MPIQLEVIKDALTKSTGLKNNNINMQTFSSAYYQMRVLVTIPYLPRLMSKSKVLRRELLDYKVDTANEILKDLRSTFIYKYIGIINETPLFIGLRRILIIIRKQKNYTKEHLRKVVIIAFVPFLIVVVKIQLIQVLNRKGASQKGGKDFSAFNDFNKDITFINVQTKDKTDVFDNFKGIGDKEYSNKPRCLLAAASQINSGLSLTPTNIVIVLDPNQII